MADKEVFGDDYYDGVFEEIDLSEHPDISAQLAELDAEIPEGQGLDKDEKEIEKMSDKELLEKVDEINEGTLGFLKDKIENAPTRKERKRAELELDIYGDTLELLEDIEDWVDEEKPKKVQKRTIAFLNKVMQRMKKAGLEDEQVATAAAGLENFINANTQVFEETVGKSHMALEGASLAIELVPLASGPKMLAEAAIGKTMAGRRLSAPGRLWHATWAGVWTVIDAAGLVVGAVAAPETAGVGTAVVEGAVLATKGLKVTKVMKIGAALMHSAKAGGKASKAILKTSQFLVKHPKLVKGAVRTSKYGDKLSDAAKISGAASTAVAGGKAVVKLSRMQERANLFERVSVERSELLDTLDDIFRPAA